MNIVLCTETYFYYSNGVVTFVDMLAKELRKQGHSVLVIAPDHHAKHHEIKDHVLHCPAKKSKKLYLDYASPLNLKRYLMVRSFRPDVIHIQHEGVFLLFGMRTAALLRVPLVYTLHSEYSKYMFYAVKQWMIPWATRSLASLIRHIGKQAMVVTSPSRKGLDYFRSIGSDRDVEIIQNSVEVDDFDPMRFNDEQKRDLRKKLGLADTDMCALFVGRLGPEKSIATLLEYWSETVKSSDGLKLLLV